MDATRIDFEGARPLLADWHRMAIAKPSESPTNALSSTWLAIHDAAATVGRLAGVDQVELRRLVEFGRDAIFEPPGPGWCNEVDDLAEILRRGIAALLAAHTSGRTPPAAAWALWAEFLVARDAIMRRSLQGAINHPA